MGVKKNPSSLFILSLETVGRSLLRQWTNTFYTDYFKYSQELKSEIGTLIPYTIYDKIFDFMIDTHGRLIQNNKSNDKIPSITCLIDTVITPNLHRLNLNCLRHIGIVKDEEIKYLEYILITELPNLSKLVELSLQTSGTDFTLPTCNDEVMDKIGSSCPNLRTLDISYNHTVTDKGLEYIVPSDSRGGCPLLTKLSLFECSVTADGVVVLFVGLPHLQFLGYRETGQALMHGERRELISPLQKLKICHINNLGIISRTCKDINKLRCNEEMVNAICNYCPKLTGLKVRVNDSEVKFLNRISSLSILELVFNLGTPSSPGSNTVQYLQLCGEQLVSLSFVCDVFSTKYLKVVCEQCNNLKRIWIRSNRFICDQDITKADKQRNCLLKLEVFFFRVGCVTHEVCRIPLNVLHYILHKASALTEVVLAMRNSLICDLYIQDLFGSIQTSKLKHIMVLVPYKNVTLSSLNLSMATVEALIGMCPSLEQIGNLLVWDVSLEEIQELRRQLKLSNSALVLLYRLMYS